MENKYFNDENHHSDFLKANSTARLYQMWQTSEAGSARAYLLEKTIKQRTGKWIDELEQEEFLGLKKSLKTLPV